jgi:hypothetical protein
MKHFIHINRHKIAANKKTGANEAPISVKNYRGSKYGHEVTIHGPCKVVYRPCDPLSCGATVFIVVEDGVEVEVR